MVPQLAQIAAPRMGGAVSHDDGQAVARETITMTTTAMNRFRVAVAGALLALGFPAAAADTVVASEEARFRMVPVVTHLESPWSIAFLDEHRMLVTEKEGRLRMVERGRLVRRSVDGLPPVRVRGQGGLLDVAPHPRFADNGLVYWTFANGESDVGVEVARGRLVAAGSGEYRLEAVEVIFRQVPKLSGGLHFGSRLVWDRSGHLFVTLGDRGQMKEAQDLSHHLGKVLRIAADGAIPPDNPFVGKPGARPEIWTLGNRNVQGAALHPKTGELWAHEHGPQGGDEVNILRAGRNYGWPVITYGVNYGTGTRIGEGHEKPGMEQPLWKWVPTSIAPSGMAFYSGEKFPRWRGNLLLGALRGEALVRLTLDGDRVVREERIGGFGRVRDVRSGPDGFVYVVSESNGTVYRLEPV